MTDVDGLALQLAGVTRRFSGLTAVSEVSLRVAPGARHGIIGPNGAGKTTLFNVISGELPATSGSITLFDRDITRLSPGERVGIRQLLQRLPPDLTLVMIEHDMDLVRDVVNRTTVLHFGEVVAEGSSDEIQRDATVRAIYLGSRQAEA